MVGYLADNWVEVLVKLKVVKLVGAKEVMKAAMKV